MPELKITTRKRRVLRLPRNTRGRDLIITDPHGAYDLVWVAMKAANFDPSCDRLLVGGDLIDRGAGSARAGKDKGHLTMVDVRMQTMYLAQPPAARDDRRLDLRIAGEIPAAPFSGCDEPATEDADSPRM